MRIKSSLPFGVHFLDDVSAEIARKYVFLATEIAYSNLKGIPDSIENKYADAFAIPDVLEEVATAKREGFDGVLIKRALRETLPLQVSRFGVSA